MRSAPSPLWRLLVLALAFAGGSALAQQPAPAAPAAARADAQPHTFQIVAGEVYHDGVHVPGAVPAHLDLGGYSTPPMEYVGPVVPVIEVDGRAYVYEDRRLVPLAESSRAGRSVFMMGDLVPEVDPVTAVPDDALALVSEEVYLRAVAERDRALYEQLHRERTMEVDALRLAERVRATPPGPARTAARADLREMLSQLLALKHTLRREEAARAQQELDAFRAALDDRERRHDAIVDARLRELIGE